MPANRPCILSHVPLQMLAGIAAEFPGCEFVQVPAQGDVPPGVAGEVLLTFTWGSPNMREVLARGVRWVHTLGTGIDAFPTNLLGDRTLTCARGASAIPMSEWTLAMLLACEKQLPETWLSQPPENWNRGNLGGLHGRTLGIVGLGGIGEAIAQRALCFGMRVRAIRRTPGPGGVAGIEMAAGLHELLAGADHVVIVAPGTTETRHLIGRDAFAAMKPGAHLVNISRGTLIDQDALREALDSGRVARASLDVADPEPLPAGHWLYSHPRVYLSPHVSWSMPGSIQLLLETFAENLRRRAAGEPLAGQVDLSLGY